MPWLKGWKNRLELRILPDRVDAGLADFPTLIYINKSFGRNRKDLTFIFDELESEKNRKKIAVTLADGITQCFVEIESWEHSKREARLYAKLPHLSSSAINIFLL